MSLAFDKTVVRDAGKIAGTGAAALAPKRLRSAAKIGGALALLAVGAYAILSERGYVASENAVVSAYVISLRAPIEGYVSGIRAEVGTSVDEASALAHMENPRVDDQLLADLRARLGSLEAQRVAAEAERMELLALREDLGRRSRAHAIASAARLSALVQEAGRSLAAKEARRDQVARDLERRSGLARSGTVSGAEVERLRADYDIAAREADAQKAHLSALHAEAEAVGRGVIADPGANDVAYSTQRSDEVTIRLAELGRTIATLSAQLDETRSRLVSEERRVGLMRTAELSVPASGMIWKLGASDGERLGAGDMVAEIVDCRAAFLVAAIPQDRVPDIEIGGEARFRLSGEREERIGAVLSVTGEATLANDRNLAASPVEQSRRMATVRVSMPKAQDATDCLVGRSTRVLLPTTGGGPVDSVLRRFL